MSGLLEKASYVPEIRTLCSSDYPEVRALWERTSGMGLNDYDDSQQGFDRYLARNPGTCFAAFDGARLLIGVILSGHDGRRGFIYHMAVDSSRRNSGIGSALLERALDALAAEGIRKVALVAFAANEAGNRFWERRGFARRDDLVYRNRSIP